MDNNLAANDPYREMDSGEKSIRPGFLGGNGDGASGFLNKAEQAASMALAAKGGGAGAAGKAGGAAKAGGAGKAGGEGAGGLGGGIGSKKKPGDALKDGMKSGAAEGAEAKENQPGGLYNKGGGKEDGEEQSLKMPKSMKTGLKVAAPFLILLVGVLAIVILVVALPILMIGALDYNLLKILGFEGTVAVLEKIGSYVTKEFLSEGEVPSDYAVDLAAFGIDVGQVTANGDFIKTNVYIANIEDKDDLVAAAGGFSYIPEDNGELAVLYNGKIIRADDFVVAVESDPVLYAAYSGAADISTKYYFSDDVDQVYKDMGISRGTFNDWKNTGDYKKDEEKFLEIMNKTLDKKSNLTVAGYFNDNEFAKKPDDASPGLIEKIKSYFSDEQLAEGTFEVPVSDGKSPDEITSSVAEKTKEYVIKFGKGEEENEKTKQKEEVPKVEEQSSNATERAAELLNTAISSGEPYLASSAFMAVEEPIQRARIDGDGPVNQVMNTLTQGKSVSYEDISNGGTKTAKKSILETDNFRAAVSDSRYSKDEATNFSRDRVIKATGDIISNGTIQGTVITTNGRKQSESAVRNGILGDPADNEVVSKANGSLKLAVATNNSEVFQTVVGGNRIIEGGSFISNTINMKVAGAMPSDAGTIAAYDVEVEEVLARRAEAERATRSPFDITSPHTFLGSIVHNMATTMLGNYTTAGSLLTATNMAVSNTGLAISSLVGGATAEGPDQKFTTMSGNGCKTVGTVGVEGDLYCTSHNTISQKYKKEDWDGKIDEEKYKEFVSLAMSRDATVGVKSAEVCDKYAEDKGAITHFFHSIANLFSSCWDVPDEVATGSKYAFNGEGEDFDAELYAGYAAYDEVRSLLSGEKSQAAVIREEYYKKHPKDNSEAAIIARRSGMTKHEAEIALAYADYLNEIALYNPSSRFDFTAPVVSIEKPILEYHSNEVALELYAWYSKQAEYDDLRTRNFVV